MGENMYYYQIAKIVIKSEYKLSSFESFICNEGIPDILLVKTEELPPCGIDVESGSIIHRRVENGWFFHEGKSENTGVCVDSDYSRIKVLGVTDDTIYGMMEWYVRIAVECMLARRGYVSLHAASVEVNGEAFAFTGPSGLGKSTRAEAWIKGIDAKLINGDRPLIDVRNGELYGVPWDGKEKCFRNVHYPLKAICEVRRSDSVYVRKMSLPQKRKLLMKQCFLPMWDTETAAIQMMNITKLAKSMNIVRIFCGPNEEDAGKLYGELQNNNYLEEKKDMVAKKGFVLRNVVDEHILMPTGDNIGVFGGSVVMNDVSAFIWEKLQNPISKEDLLQAVLDEFDVEKDAAEADLDALLAQLKEYGVIDI
ncbi:MAG: PqqD family peptide modification chaperone [Lachnospiraceae bacterium]|nr:PqqD family peptide modification chaperone [Lachnospiraceae bacterium]